MIYPLLTQSILKMSLIMSSVKSVPIISKILMLSSSPLSNNELTQNSIDSETRRSVVSKWITFYVQNTKHITHCNKITFL